MTTVSDSYREYVLEQLGRVRPVRTKRLFGAVGLYAGEVMFALIHDDVLYFKADELTRGRYEEEGSAAFQPFGDRVSPMPYYELPEDVLEQGGERLRLWLNEAVQAAVRTAKPKKPKQPKRLKEPGEAK